MDTAKIGGGLVGSISKGANLVIEQAKVNNEIWLPTYSEVHATARVAFVHFKANEIDRYSDYKKFGSESKLGESHPTDESGDTSGGSLPSMTPPTPSSNPPQPQPPQQHKPQ
jgi:hypothetical protein